MGDWTVTLSSEEEKALLVDVISIQDWLNNAVHNKARQCRHKIVLDKSDKQPSKISEAEINQIVAQAEVETAVKRNARIEGEEVIPRFIPRG